MSENYLVITFYLDLSVSECGYPVLCPGTQPKFMRAPFQPPTLASIQIQDELEAFFQQSEQIYKKTGVPICPISLQHLICCLPCTPLCCTYGFQSWRDRAMTELIENWNIQHGIPRGLYLQWNNMQSCQGDLTTVGTVKPGIELRLNKDAHRIYCDKVGRPFPVLPEDTVVQAQAAGAASLPVQEQPMSSKGSSMAFMRVTAPPTYDETLHEEANV